MVKIWQKNCEILIYVIKSDQYRSVSIKQGRIMLYFERQKKILELIKKHECVTVEFLCERIFASPATIRRDLAQMFENNLITRVRGGAALLEGSNHDEPSFLRFSKNIDKKKENSRDRDALHKKLHYSFPRLKLDFRFSRERAQGLSGSQRRHERDSVDKHSGKRLVAQKCSRAGASS